MRKNHKRWVHYSYRHGFDFIIECGKISLRSERTTDKNKVTCPRCIEIMEANK